MNAPNFSSFVDANIINLSDDFLLPSPSDTYALITILCFVMPHSCEVNNHDNNCNDMEKDSNEDNHINLET